MRVGLALVFVAACTGGAATSAAPSGISSGTPPIGDVAPSTSASPGTGLPSADAGSSARGPHACTPLNNTADTLPALYAAPAIGRAKDGTVYVVLSDDGDLPEVRVFISSRQPFQGQPVNTFQGQQVLGASQVGTLFELTLADRKIDVEAASLASPATRMSVGGEDLTLLTGSDLTAMDFKVVFEPNDQASTAVAAYVAGGPSLMIVTPPFPTSNRGTYRVFYGASVGDNALMEQQATVVGSSALTVTFSIDGTSYAAYLPNENSPPALGGPTLTLSGATTASYALTYATPALDFNVVVDGGATLFVTARPPPTGPIGANAAPDFTCF